MDKSYFAAREKHAGELRIEIAKHLGCGNGKVVNVEYSESEYFKTNKVQIEFEWGAVYATIMEKKTFGTKAPDETI